jgi:hypothetical protein
MKDPGDRVPILSFLNKHKWRIILPLLFALLYWSVPRYQFEPVAVQQNLFIKSSVYGESDVRQEVAGIQKKVLGDEFLAGVVAKYDLYNTAKSENIKIEKLRNSIEVRVADEDFVGGTAVFVWANFRKENGYDVASISNDLAAPFEAVQGFHIEKFVTRPYDSNPYRNYAFFGGFLQGIFLLVIPLILLWEIPNWAFSSKTKKEVFDPLMSDWQNELLEAKQQDQTWKALEINIKYSGAFIWAMLQRSPIGDAVEVVRKIKS